MQAIRPVGVGSTGGANLTTLLDEMRSAILELQTPPGPVQLAGVLEADLPDAAAYTGAIVYVTDLFKVALSNGTTWTDTTGGAL